MSDQTSTEVEPSQQQSEEGESKGANYIRRLPEEEDVGPYFPSGMSAPEAYVAGATEGVVNPVEVAQQRQQQAEQESEE